MSFQVLCCRYQATEEELALDKKRKPAATAAKKKPSPPEKTPSPAQEQPNPAHITPEKPLAKKPNKVVPAPSTVPPRRLSFKGPDPDQAKQIENLQKALQLVFQGLYVVSRTKS